MPTGHKIATCTYCGTRAALRLKKDRHELACATCGAPLHELKMLRSDAVAGAAQGQVRRQTPRPRPQSHRQKPRRSLARRIAHELWDAADDIFDIFD